MGYGTGLLGAVTAGATGYTQGALEAQKQAILRAAVKRKQEQEDAARARQETQDAEAREQRRVENLMKGYTPGGTTVTVEEPGAGDAPTGARQTPAQPTDRTFDDALATAGAAAGLPTTAARGPLDGPAAPRLGGVPRVKVVTTPESFDPAKSSAGYLEGERERARAEGRRETLDSQETRSAEAIASRERIAKSRELGAAARAKMRAAGASRTLTPNARLQYSQTAAKGLLGIHGTPDAAKAFLASPDGADLRAAGVTPGAIDIVGGLRAEADTRTATGMAGHMRPERAVAAVRGVRTAMGTPPGTPPATPAPRTAPPRSLTTPAPSQPAPPAPPVRTGPPPRSVTGSTRATSTGLMPLSPAHLEKARTDPAFKAFLRKKGYHL